ncbi:MAG: NADP-dependent malic enzyme [Megasphaera sp.]|jgi:malate dehydrogenase (oxaloacetate-decarboxylating)|nr:NADP-dependent malic enzyme [Megasphaera sp.]MCH4188559.1 NADP-dependent malic enzyme [Megasphaera sp.]MCH4218446.1 NADP-dependent malic enzyme [Megasphaera sp.]
MSDNKFDEALALHKTLTGKLTVSSKMPADSKEALSLLYTPGVAAPCLEIAEDTNRSYEYTGRGNYVAVITDGSAILGLGNIGPEAGMPVMEGKCLLFSEFSGINAVPLCIDTQNVEEIIKFVQLTGPSFGGINLEDISGPRCFEIERRLRETMDIPVFHDDQHGTAIIVLAGVINALKLVGKKKETVQVVINGGGAAGLSIGRLLLEYGFANVTICDINGAIYEGDPTLNPAQADMAAKTNRRQDKGTLEEIIKGKDVFIGVSRGGLVSSDMIRSMAADAICFAMANPIPEIYPQEAKEAGAKVVGSGRSDFPNQVNNVLVFPGVFRGALDCHASDISEGMKLAAAAAIAAVAEQDGLREDYILPDAFDKRVTINVAAAVAQAAAEEGIARRPMTFEEEVEQAKAFVN